LAFATHFINYREYDAMYRLHAECSIWPFRQRLIVVIVGSAPSAYSAPSVLFLLLVLLLLGTRSALSAGVKFLARVLPNLSRPEQKKDGPGEK
jgi:hypothetical protein